ncbi:MAG: nitronate monooxygenase, partial [Pseudomonadota bacterium]
MTETIRTRFTERFDIAHPIMLAPMDLVSGGALAAAVSRAGGLGLIGGGYGEADWLERAFLDAGNERVGVGFITWSVAERPELIAAALARRPAALMVSFGDAEPLIEAARAAGTPTVWQVQRLSQARQALAAGVDVIVVQGQEAGGHGMDRGLTALLPAVRDLAGPEQILLAAGGLADGRGLAAALMLGADGVMMGTRFWASAEAAGSDAAKAGLVAAGGDDTLRTKVFDVARDVGWPWEFTGRVVEND